MAKNSKLGDCDREWLLYKFVGQKVVWLGKKHVHVYIRTHRPKMLTPSQDGNCMLQLRLPWNPPTLSKQSYGYGNRKTVIFKVLYFTYMQPGLAPIRLGAHIMQLVLVWLTCTSLVNLYSHLARINLTCMILVHYISWVDEWLACSLEGFSSWQFVWHGLAKQWVIIIYLRYRIHVVF